MTTWQTPRTNASTPAFHLNKGFALKAAILTAVLATALLGANVAGVFATTAPAAAPVNVAIAGLARDTAPEATAPIVTTAPLTAPIQPEAAADLPATQPVVTAPAASPVAPVVAPAAPVVVAAAPAVAAPAFYLPSVSTAAATSPELALLAAMNAERAKAGLAPFTLDAGLTTVARTRSQQMVDQNYFSHTDANGTMMYTALLRYFGYSYAWAGENLALNNYAPAEAVDRAIVALMASPTHRANIMATDFFRVGIGEVTTPDGRHFFTTIFLG